MNRILGIALFLFTMGLNTHAELTNQWSYDLSRAYSKEIFETNGIPYINPMVEAVNATSNSRFFTTAFVPKEVDKPYIKFSIHGMYGLVRDDMKTYVPFVPNEEFDLNKVDDYLDLFPFAINDTAGLILYLFKTVLYDGIQDGSLVPPTQASTILGSRRDSLWLDPDTLKRLVEDHDLYPFLPENLRDSVLSAITSLPGFFTFPPGGKINSIFAGVPQIEIGSLWGTELLLRYIPPIDFGQYIGTFSFWGFALKHSISQYFPKPFMDIAVQVAYQGTSLENKVGETNAELNSITSMFNFNIHASKSIGNVVDIYSGISFENLSISADFKYYLPIDIQRQLGLLERVVDENGNLVILPPDPARGFPGDTKPQTSNVTIDDFNFKWVIGLHKNFGPFSIFADFNFSQFNIFTFGLQYRVDFGRGNSFDRNTGK